MRHLSALITVAYQSLRYRMSGVLLTLAAVALSIFVLLSVEHIRHEARSGFASSVSGVDLIVGARTGEINLLLLSVFRIGNATANVSWETLEEIKEQQQVTWIVPISLGDSHQQFRVVGTTYEFFDRYKYGRKQSLTFREGGQFAARTEVVIGAQVAAELGYGLGDSLVLSHGMADTSFDHHEEMPFNVVGILNVTGTPVDNALFLNLEAIESIHAVDDHEDHTDHEEYADQENESHPPIGKITALLLGLRDPISTLQMQRWINEYSGEALLAILPGVALAQLWELIGSVEVVLRGISIIVFVSSIFGLNAMLLASMRERRREIEILRSIGAPSKFIFGLLIIESLLIVTMATLIAIGSLLLAITLVNQILAGELGVVLSLQIFYTSSLAALALIYLVALLVSLVPAIQAYTVSRALIGSRRYIS